jgi:hypothetical protein
MALLPHRRKDLCDLFCDAGLWQYLIVQITADTDIVESPSTTRQDFTPFIQKRFRFSEKRRYKRLMTVLCLHSVPAGVYPELV